MSPAAHAFWPRFYRFLRLLDVVIYPLWRRFGIGNTVELLVPGRRSGRTRRVLIGVLRLPDGRRYIGHPDLECAWTLNLEAAGLGQLRHHDGSSQRFRALLLPRGPERDAVIRATFRQHPFPGTLFYWLTRRHIRAVGRFYRVEGVGASVEDVEIAV